MKNPNHQFLLPLGLAVCLSLTGDLTLFASLVPKSEQMGITLAQAGILLSVHRMIRIPGNPLTGVLVDRFGRRVIFIAGMICAVLSTTMVGLVSNFALLVTGRLLWGAAWSMINVAGMTMVLDCSDDRTRGTLTGLYNAWVWAGYALGPLIGSFLADQIGLRYALVILAGITAIGLIVALFSLPETKGVRKIIEVQPTTYSTVQSQDRPFYTQGIFRAAILIFVVTQFCGDGVVLSTISLLLTERFGTVILLGNLSLGVASLTGIFMSIRSILAAVIGPSVGRLSDRRWGRLPLLIVGLASGIVSFLLFALESNIITIFIGIVIGAFSTGSLWVGLPALMGDIVVQDDRGKAMGIFAAIGDVGSSLGPLLALSLANVLRLPFIYLVCAILLAICIMVAGKYTQRSQKPGNHLVKTGDS